MRALCLRNHIVPPRQSVGAVRRRAQVGTDQVCDRGRCSLLGLCGRKSRSWKFGVFGVRLCVDYILLYACVRACAGRMGGWRGFHWMSQSLLGNGWWKHLWAVCHLLLLPLLLLMVSSLCSVESPGAPSCSPGKLNRKSDDPCFTSLLKVKVKQPSIANRGSAPFHGRSPHATTEQSEPSHRERLQSKKRVFKSEINPASSFGIIRKAGLFLGFCRFSQVSVMATPSSLFVSERRCCLLPPNIS